jgi:pimeloyl-ACP methyl ester carboxylesterase
LPCWRRSSSARRSSTRRDNGWLRRAAERLRAALRGGGVQPARPITLRAWWIPADDARAALIVVYGAGDDNRSVPDAEGLALARDLVTHLRAPDARSVELRRVGRTPEGVTFGDLEVNDVVGGLDYLTARAPTLRAAAIGFSMGGATVLRAAARDRRLHAVVANSAFADVRGLAVVFTNSSWLRQQTPAPRPALRPRPSRSQVAEAAGIIGYKSRRGRSPYDSARCENAS